MIKYSNLIEETLRPTVDQIFFEKYNCTTGKGYTLTGLSTYNRVSVSTICQAAIIILPKTLLICNTLLEENVFLCDLNNGSFNSLSSSLNKNIIKELDKFIFIIKLQFAEVAISRTTKNNGGNKPKIKQTRVQTQLKTGFPVSSVTFNSVYIFFYGIREYFLRNVAKGSMKDLNINALSHVLLRAFIFAPILVAFPIESKVNDSVIFLSK